MHGRMTLWFCGTGALLSTMVASGEFYLLGRAVFFFDHVRLTSGCRQASLVVGEMHVVVKVASGIDAVSAARREKHAWLSCRGEEIKIFWSLGNRLTSIFLRVDGAGPSAVAFHTGPDKCGVFAHTSRALTRRVRFVSRWMSRALNLLTQRTSQLVMYLACDWREGIWEDESCGGNEESRFAAVERKCVHNAHDVLLRIRGGFLVGVEGEKQEAWLETVHIPPRILRWFEKLKNSSKDVAPIDLHPVRTQATDFGSAQLDFSDGASPSRA